jgi:hypothetical protein
LRLAEAIDDVAEMKKELRHVHGCFVVKVGSHLVGDERLAVRTASRAGIADRVEDKLPLSLDTLHCIVATTTEHLRQGQHRLWHPAWGRNRQRRELVLSVQLVDGLVCRIVRWMVNTKLFWVRCRLRLCEDGVPVLGRLSVTGRLSRGRALRPTSHVEFPL